MGWMASKQFLTGKSADLCERILDARVQKPESNILHDPIEDHPDFAETIAKIREATETGVRAEITQSNATRRASGDQTFERDWPMGTCHLIWRRMKERLAEEGIIWYSPAEMNPGHIFD